MNDTISFAPGDKPLRQNKKKPLVVPPTSPLTGDEVLRSGNLHEIRQALAEANEAFGLTRGQPVPKKKRALSRS